MMIGKGKSISHTGASMSYGWNQEKEAQVVFKQELTGDTPKDITREFKQYRSLIPTVRKTRSLLS